MSETDSDEDPNALKKALRTVTPGPRMHRDVEMDAIGWTIFAGLVVMLLPLLPVLVAVWLLTKLLGRLLGRATE